MKVSLSTLLSLLLGGLVLTSTSSQAGEGVRVKAAGNTPDWQLEIMQKGNRINFTVDGNAGVYHYGKAGPTLYGKEKMHVYRVLDKAHSMSVFVYGKACQDSKTGKSHEVTVLVTFDDSEYRGCGDVLTWLLEP